MKSWTIALLLLSTWTSLVSGKVSLDTLQHDLNQYLASGTGSQDFWDTLDAITLKNPVKGNNPKVEIKLLEGVEGQARVELSCILCSNVADTVLGWVERGDSREQLVNQTTALCVTTGIAKENICRGVIDSYIDMFMWLSEEKNSTGDPVTSNEFCGFALYPDCPLRAPEYDWTLDLSFMGPKPEYQQPQIPPEGSPTLQILQFTDVHVDPNYLVGGNAACDEPTCCRFDQPLPENASDAAGYWGDYRDCDLPVHAYLDLVQQAKRTHPNAAYVVFTGDVIDHGVWATSLEGNRDLFDLVIGEMRRNFPNVPLLPIFGNHEPHPLNVYSSGDWPVPVSVSSESMYRHAATTWEAWLPGIAATVMRGGYYSVAVRPGLLVVALNNNICYSYNWWMIYDSFDPAGQLVWLAQTLMQAEAANQKVHILSHLSGDSGGCFKPWRIAYRKIIDRFANVITAQFFGHTHDDVFNVYYDLDDPGLPTNLAFSGGSGTPYSDANPNYKAYTLEDGPGASYQVLDFESWYYNLTEANLGGAGVAPNWQKLYSFKQDYGVSSLSPADMDALVYRMAADTDLQHQYFSFAVKLGDSSLNSGCSAGCLKSYVCDIVSNTEGKCDELGWPEAP